MDARQEITLHTELHPQPVCVVHEYFHPVPLRNVATLGR